MADIDFTKLPDKKEAGLDLGKLPDQEVEEVKDPRLKEALDKSKDAYVLPSFLRAAGDFLFGREIKPENVPEEHREAFIKETGGRPVRPGHIGESDFHFPGLRTAANWAGNQLAQGPLVLPGGGVIPQPIMESLGPGLASVGEGLLNAAIDPSNALPRASVMKWSDARRMETESRFANAKNVTPKPPSRRLTSGDTRGITLRPYNNDLPPTTNRRFLGNAETLNPIAARESRFKIPDASATDIRENGPGWVDVEKPEPGGEKKRLRFTKEGTLVDPQTGEDGIQLARTKGGGIKIGADIRRSAQELTTGYSGDLPAIMMREGLQNAIDAVRHLGENGIVQVKMPSLYGPDPKYIEIRDNGKGMTMKDLQTVFSDLHSSGKTREGGATGGKGVGKASYMLGGQHFMVQTTVKEGPNIVRHTMQGTPEEFMTEVKPKTELMPAGTPTGTVIKTDLLPEQGVYYAKEMLEQVQKYSRGLQSKIQTQLGPRYSWDEGTPEFKDSEFPATLHSNDLHLGVKDFGHSTAELSIPHTVSKEDKERSAIRVRVLNNGMYQYSDTHFLDEATKGLPDEISVNIEPKVEEGSKDYPFPVQRESLKEGVREEINKFINDTLVTPRRARAKSKLKEIYENLAIIPTEGKRFRNSILFDPGDRLTSAEKNMLVNSPFIKQLTTYLDDFIEETLIRLGNEDVHKRLEGVGIVLDPNMHGVHIPNPENPKARSIILINPFEHPKYEGSPFETALSTVVTTMHEMAHIGLKDVEAPFKFDPTDMAHPDVGRFLSTYAKEVQDHGGLDLGHGMAFIKRLGELYAKAGIEEPIRFATDYTRLLSNTEDRRNLQYTPEFQDILRVYEESRGRSATTEDYLSGTGTKSVTPSGRRSRSTSSSSSNGGGVPRKPIIDRIGQYDSGRSKPPDPVSVALRNQVENDGILLRAAGFFKGMKATADLGPVLRQGIAYTGRPFWWKALRQQFVSYASEGGHERFLEDLKTDPLNQPRWVTAGGKATSWYDLAGVDITHLGGPLRGQEEAIMGMDLTEKPIKWVSEKTGVNLVNPVRASNRAYSDAILSLRRGASQVLYDNYKKVYESAKKSATTEKGKSDAESYNPDNPLVAQNIGLEINRASGRGRLSTPELRLPKSRFLGPASGAKLARSFSAEPVADILAVGLFSPRLFTSRIQNINKVLNPWSWATSPKPMRIEYLKQLLSIAGIIVAGNSLMSLFGAETGPLGGDEPTSPDFLKSRFGKGRRGVNIDFTGGYGRFATLGARLATREVTTGAGKRFRVGQPPIGDAVSLIEDFGEGLASPVMQAAMQLLNGKEFGNKPLDMTNPNPFENSAGKALLTPMISQDLYDLLQEDPSYVPLLFPDALGAPLTIYGQ